MNLQKTYPSLLTADIAAAEGWYTKLLGRRPDHRPMPTLLQWELADEGGLMLSSSKDIATRGAIFLYVADLCLAAKATLPARMTAPTARHTPIDPALEHETRKLMAGMKISADGKAVPMMAMPIGWKGGRTTTDGRLSLDHRLGRRAG